MIGVAIATQGEWDAVLEILNIDKNQLQPYPFGNYINIKMNNKDVIFYQSGYRKVNSSGAAQYMIDKFKLNKIAVIGTCAGINEKYKVLDILIPTIAVQCDCTVKEVEPLIKQRFIVKLKGDSLEEIKIGTLDKAVVMWKDFKELQENHIDIADCESAAVAYICKLNHVECSIIKGISDFPIYQEQGKENKTQIAIYEQNTPIIMKKILENYLIKEIC